MVHLKHDFYTNYRLVGKLVGANMNVQTDNIIPITPQAELFTLTRIVVTNASISLTTAAGGVYTAASKAGSAIVAAGQVYSALTTSVKFVSLTLASISLTDVINSATQTNLYLSLTTAQGAPATADVYVYGITLQGNAA